MSATRTSVAVSIVSEKLQPDMEEKVCVDAKPARRGKSVMSAAGFIILAVYRHVPRNELTAAHASR